MNYLPRGNVYIFSYIPSLDDLVMKRFFLLMKKSFQNYVKLSIIFFVVEYFYLLEKKNDKKLAIFSPIEDELIRIFVKKIIKKFFTNG